MSNPRLIAEDIAQHYKENRNEHLPHAKNIRRCLRKPVLAITRRILLPRMDYENDAIIQSIGNEQFGEKTNVDPTFAKGKEGLDWRDYLTTDPSLPKDIDTDLSFSETETETEGEQTREQMRTHVTNLNRKNAGAGASTGANPVLKTMKLSRRTLARMEAFLASTAYALPNDAVSAVHNRKDPIKNVVPNLRSLASAIPSPFRKKIQAAIPSNNNNASNADTGTSSRKANGGTAKNKIRTYPQMHINDLILRLELYIRTLRRMHTNLSPKEDTNTNANGEPLESDECVIHLEPAKAMKIRVNLLINSLVSTVGSVGSMRHILNNLLVHFTREMLAVELVSEDLQSYIRKIVLEYEHLTSFASLAFLSTPEDSAETQLAPLLSNYVGYLQKEWKKCVWECRLESTLARAIDPAVRKLFKTVEFVSIGHLLDVCHEHKHALENITISSKDFDCSGTTLNGNGVAMASATTGNTNSSFNSLSSASFDKNPMEFSSNTKVIKQALRDLRRETIIINGQILPPVQSLKELVNLLKERLNSRPLRLKERKVGNGRKARSKSDELTKSSIDSSSDSHQSASDTDFISSGNEGDEEDEEDSPHQSKRKMSLDVSTMSMPGTQNPEAKSGKRKQLVDTIDIMTRRLLLAASRTRGGGDAYFVVSDLFGGEGVQVIPSRVQTHGPYFAGSISPTIELTVRLASITIKCHSVFDIYPDNVDECEPFIQLKTATTETIELQEVRIDDHGLELELSPHRHMHSNESPKPTKVMLKEKTGELSGRRFLTITPAKYERVDNRHTPS